MLPYLEPLALTLTLPSSFTGWIELSVVTITLSLSCDYNSENKNSCHLGKPLKDPFSEVFILFQNFVSQTFASTMLLDLKADYLIQ